MRRRKQYPERDDGWLTDPIECPAAARRPGPRPQHPPAKVSATIHLPAIAPAIAAAALVFIDVMKELPATLLLQPFNFTTLATALYGEAKRGTYEDGAIAALAIVLVGLIPMRGLSCRGARHPKAARWRLGRIFDK